MCVYKCALELPLSGGGATHGRVRQRLSCSSSFLYVSCVALTYINTAKSSASSKAAAPFERVTSNAARGPFFTFHTCKLPCGKSAFFEERSSGGRSVLREVLSVLSLPRRGRRMGAVQHAKTDAHTSAAPKGRRVTSYCSIRVQQQFGATGEQPNHRRPRRRRSTSCLTP